MNSIHVDAVLAAIFLIIFFVGCQFLEKEEKQEYNIRLMVVLLAVWCAVIYCSITFVYIFISCKKPILLSIKMIEYLMLFGWSEQYVRVRLNSKITSGFLASSIFYLSLLSIFGWAVICHSPMMIIMRLVFDAP